MPSAIEYLLDWKSPILHECSFACVASTRSETGPATAHELDSLLQQLPSRIAFEASFTNGKQLVTSWPVEPEEDDFDSVEEGQDAYDKFWPKAFDAKPWVNQKTSMPKLCLFRTLTSVMEWSINNKEYEVVSTSGIRKRVAFSRDVFEKQLIEKQEREHRHLVEEFAAKAVELFSTTALFQRFESNHQLDTLAVPDVSPAECFGGCFYDETLVFVGDANCLLVWVGHLRWYG